MAFKNSLETTELLKSSQDNTGATEKSSDSDSSTGGKKTSHLLLGMLAVFVSNLFTLGSDYSIKLFNLQYGELFFVLGTSGTIVYGSILLFKGGLSYMLPGGLTEWKDYIALTIAFALTSGLGAIVSVGAVKLMPMGDLVVLKFSSPIPTYFLTVYLLKEKHSLPKLSLCLFLLLGDILVVQPPMLFPDHRDSTKEWPYYWFGVIIAMATATSLAINGVLLKRIQKASNFSIYHMLFFTLGPGVIVYFLATLTTNMQNTGRFLFPHSSLGPSMDWRELGLLFGTALIMHLKFVTILGGCALATPMLMVSIRNLEILMVLSVEICAFNHYPALITTVGIVLVLGSVFGLAFLDAFRKKS